MTRESLGKLGEEEFEAFLDDVTEVGLKKACEARIWTVGATLNWLEASDDRKLAFERALRARAEIRFHEGGEIVDSASPDDVAVAKLRSAWRRDEAKVWSRERYGDRVAVDKAVTVGVDAGLIGFAGALLERMKIPTSGRMLAVDVEGETVVIEQGKIAQKGPEAVLVEADAPETAREPDLAGRVSIAGALPPVKSPGRSVVGPI